MQLFYTYNTTIIYNMFCHMQNKGEIVYVITIGEQVYNMTNWKAFYVQRKYTIYDMR